MQLVTTFPSPRDTRRSLQQRPRVPHMPRLHQPGRKQTDGRCKHTKIRRNCGLVQIPTDRMWDKTIPDGRRLHFISRLSPNSLFAEATATFPHGEFPPQALRFVIWSRIKENRLDLSVKGGGITAVSHVDSHRREL